eukprot:6041716-Lingulodinium_polyedra.AAC.1
MAVAHRMGRDFCTSVKATAVNSSGACRIASLGDGPAPDGPCELATPEERDVVVDLLVVVALPGSARGGTTPAPPRGRRHETAHAAPKAAAWSRKCTARNRSGPGPLGPPSLTS